MAQATLSPSPIAFGTIPSIHDNNEIPISFERRRRLSHPHNSQNSQAPGSRPHDMADYPWSNQRPSLEHRTSQTIVDLTGDVDEPRRQHPPAPPRLGRSDSEIIGSVVVDLTEDDDVQIISSRSINVPENPQSQGAHQPQPRNSYNYRRLPHPFLQHHAHGHVREHPQHGRTDSPPLFVPQGPVRVHGGHGIGQLLLDSLPALRPHLVGLLGGQNEPGADAIPYLHHLNYEAHAFNPPRMHRAPAPAPKPIHVPPKPAGEGFTRSPQEDDMIVCPGCDEELTAQKLNGEVVLPKKNGKGPSKAERAEHPFWVLRDCGHVYCNSCFQNRKHKTDTKFSAPVIGVASKTSLAKVHLECAVEDCGTQINDRKQWVGVFL